MKALYVYNPNSKKELEVIKRAKKEMDKYITLIPLDSASNEIKSLIRDTPALIIVSDSLQGQELIKDGVDGALIATAMLYKRLEEEEAFIHNAKTYRLDNIVNREKIKAVDDYTEELIISGVL